MGLPTALGLVGDNYQWLASIFYFGYLACALTVGVRRQMANV